MKRKIYLGDGVYAGLDGYQLVLTTENGLGVTNKIYLDPQVIESLNLFVDKCFNGEKEEEDE
jgi:hypothetical protein